MRRISALLSMLKPEAETTDPAMDQRFNVFVVGQVFYQNQANSSSRAANNER